MQFHSRTINIHELVYSPFLTKMVCKFDFLYYGLIRAVYTQYLDYLHNRLSSGSFAINLFRSSYLTRLSKNVTVSYAQE